MHLYWGSVGSFSRFNMLPRSSRFNDAERLRYNFGIISSKLNRGYSIPRNRGYHLLQLTLHMALSGVSDYESMLCEEHECNDKWWFLERAGDEGSTQCYEEESAEGRPSLPSDVLGLSSVESPSVDFCSDSLDVRLTLRASEMELIDALCSKIGSSATFKAELVRVVLALFALREVQSVAATDERIERTSTSEMCTLFCIFLTIVLVLLSGCLYWLGYNRIWEVAALNSSSMSVSGVELNRSRTVTEAEGDAEVLVEEEEAMGLWSEWYENMTEELEHNLECWSPR